MAFFWVVQPLSNFKLQICAPFGHFWKQCRPIELPSFGELQFPISVNFWSLSNPFSFYEKLRQMQPALYVLFAARRRTFPDSREISAKVPDWLACDWSPSQYLPCVVRREPQVLRRLEDKALITRSMKDSNEQQNWSKSPPKVWFVLVKAVSRLKWSSDKQISGYWCTWGEVD